MRPAFIISGLIWLGLTACTCSENDPRYPVMTAQGAFQAQIDETDREVKKVNALPTAGEQKWEDLTETVSTGYPYWEKLTYRTDEQNKVRQVSIVAEARAERYYYSPEGKLIFAQKESFESGEIWTYYFVVEKLIKVEDERGGRYPVKNSRFKSESIKLVKEAQQARKSAQRQAQNSAHEN